MSGRGVSSWRWPWRTGPRALASLASRMAVLMAVGVVLFGGLLARPAGAWAQLQASPQETGTGLVRSLESLRDLDYQSWQVVAYRAGPPGPTAPVVLRIVGYPGQVRIDHPTPLVVRAGRREWLLDDITLSSPKLSGDNRAAAAEFNLAPLLADLQLNRPVRLQLSGVFVELPVPPYVVAEWRELAEAATPPAPLER